MRQHVLNHLIHDLGCPASLTSLEHTISLNGLTKRADIVVHDRSAKPLLLVECKAPQVKVDQKVFEQAARYNLVFRVPFLMVRTASRTIAAGSITSPALLISCRKSPHTQA
ncbi:MAG TPA: type I restriction enzyme HsdR N-terminal domain-containing protein [Flavobacteriales bacterium]|nr:type I restriction enzyme HsdR N-terminal domain-containing protein [Flavobacteriales bacterium]